jgi:hypothetical protein
MQRDSMGARWIQPGSHARDVPGFSGGAIDCQVTTSEAFEPSEASASLQITRRIVQNALCLACTIRSERLRHASEKAFWTWRIQGTRCALLGILDPFCIEWQ